MDDYNERTERHNAAVTARRLTAKYVTDTKNERCHTCGELVHPFPEPEYWMQYPLAECVVIDGLSFCYYYRNPGCADAYLKAHPTPAAPIGKAGKAAGRARTSKPAEPAGDRIGRLEVLAELLPATQAELLAVAVEAVAAAHAAVLVGDDLAGQLANERYQAVIWKLNGCTHNGSFEDNKAPGRVVEDHCRAQPGTVPMWGQAGSFMIMVDGVRCWIDFARGFGSVMDCHYEFHAVDLDGPFFSETGYRSHYDQVQAGQTVDQAACAIVRAFMAKQRRYLAQDAQERLAKDALPAWLLAIEPAPRRGPVVEKELDQEPAPPGFELVDVVLTAHQAFMVRKWAAAAAPLVKAARQASRAPKAQPAREAAPRSLAARTDADEEPPPARRSIVGVYNKPDEFKVGLRCEVMSVHHPVFKKEIGKMVIVTKVNLDTGSVWVHEDRPITYRKNRKGRTVVQSDPRCIESIYSMDELRVVK